MTRIALVRHGQTSWNAANRFQGSSDVELNDIGRDQALQGAAWLAESLPNAQWDSIRFSPLSRAAETGGIIGDALSIEAQGALPSLTERDWGLAEGLTFEECVERWPQMGEVDEFAARELIPGAEPPDLVIARGRYALSTLVYRFPDAQVIAVSHGTILRLAVNDLLGGQVGFVPNTGVIVLDAWHEDGELAVEFVKKSWDATLSSR